MILSFLWMRRVWYKWRPFQEGPWEKLSHEMQVCFEAYLSIDVLMTSIYKCLFSPVLFSIGSAPATKASQAARETCLTHIAKHLIKFGFSQGDDAVTAVISSNTFAPGKHRISTISKVSVRKTFPGTFKLWETLVLKTIYEERRISHAIVALESLHWFWVHVSDIRQNASASEYSM